MSPKYNQGDWLLGRWANYSKGRGLKAGAVVVIERSEQPGILYVKRISEVRGANTAARELYLLSDNPKGTDSRQWGWIPASDVRARILFRFRRATI